MRAARALLWNPLQLNVGVRPHHNFSVRQVYLVIILTSAAGCRFVPHSAAVPCQAAPIRQRIADSLDLSTLAGVYRLAFVATKGPERERSVTGSLILHRRESTEARRRFDGTLIPLRSEPYWGSAVIALERVGAEVGGSTEADDSNVPGVSVYQTQYRDGSWEAGLLFGTSGNNLRLITLDGPNLATRIDEVTTKGFRGTWDATIGTIDYHATGFFCAVRQD